MKIDIDIDESQIDYVRINDQIIERINNMTNEELIQLTPSIHSAAFEVCKSKLNKELNDYIENKLKWMDQYGRLTENGKGYIKECMNTYIKDHMGEKIDEYIKCIDDESIKEAIKDIAPSLLVSIVGDLLNGKIFDSFIFMRNRAFEDAKGAIRYSFNQKGMSVETPYSIDNLPMTDY